MRTSTARRAPTRRAFSLPRPASQSVSCRYQSGLPPRTRHQVNPMRRLALGILFFTPLLTPALAAEKFELRQGDRVVLLGGTLIEREQRYGYWEAALTARYPDRDITFRNLGWSGDTVFAESRGVFDPPEK